MSHGHRPRDDEETKAFRRSVQANPRRTAVAVTAIILIGIGGFALAVSHSFTESEERWQARGAQRAPSPSPDQPFISTNRRAGALHAVARQAVAIRTDRHPEPDGAFAQGSGFLMTDGLVITAAHVLTSVEGSQRNTVHVLCDDVERKGTVAGIDAVRDVAAIAAPGCIGQHLTFGYVEPTVNDGLHVAGYNFFAASTTAHWFLFDTSIIPGVGPDPLRNDIQPALAQRLEEMQRLGVPPYFALAGELVPGNSGSAVFDDQGRVVGMLVAADSRFNRSYCVASSVIVDVLRNNGLPLP